MTFSMPQKNARTAEAHIVKEQNVIDATFLFFARTDSHLYIWWTFAHCLHL